MLFRISANFWDFAFLHSWVRRNEKNLLTGAREDHLSTQLLYKIQIQILQIQCKCEYRVNRWIQGEWFKKSRNGRNDWRTEEMITSLVSCYIIQVQKQIQCKYEYLYRVNGSRKVHLPTELLYFTKLVQSLPAKSIKVTQEACSRSFIRKSSIISNR